MKRLVKFLVKKNVINANYTHKEYVKTVDNIMNNPETWYRLMRKLEQNYVPYKKG